jgi:hypothetical protein
MLTLVHEPSVLQEVSTGGLAAIHHPFNLEAVLTQYEQVLQKARPVNARPSA